MGKCRKLWEFVDTIREWQAKGAVLETVVESAISYCIQNGILERLLSIHKAEVRGLILEYTFEDALKCERREGIEEGREEGVRSALIKLLEYRGALSELLRVRIMAQTNLEVLQRWFEQAIGVDSVSAFEATLS